MVWHRFATCVLHFVWHRFATCVLHRLKTGATLESATLESATLPNLLNSYRLRLLLRDELLDDSLDICSITRLRSSGFIVLTFKIIVFRPPAGPIDSNVRTNCSTSANRDGAPATIIVFVRTSAVMATCLRGMPNGSAS